VDVISESVVNEGVVGQGEKVHSLSLSRLSFNPQHQSFIQPPASHNRFKMVSFLNLRKVNKRFTLPKLTNTESVYDRACLT
jgi:hypothetical protein